jgi:hypothetical protein
MKKVTKAANPFVKKNKKATDQVGDMMPGMMGKSKKAPKTVAKVLSNNGANVDVDKSKKAPKTVAKATTKRVGKAKNDDDEDDLVGNNGAG